MPGVITDRAHVRLVSAPVSPRSVLFKDVNSRTLAWTFHYILIFNDYSIALKDGKHLYIGAPGSWYWQGQAFSQDLQEDHTLYSTRESPASDDDSYLGKNA